MYMQWRIYFEPQFLRLPRANMTVTKSLMMGVTDFSICTARMLRFCFV